MVMVVKRTVKKASEFFGRYIKIIGYLFLIALLIPSVSWFFGSGYFNMHDDLQVMRLFQMVRCFNDGQIPCRWSPDMNFGYGQAMFNFYSAFPYYLGLIYKLFMGSSYLGTAKFLFAVSLFSGGIGMFLLARQFWGYWGGVVSAVLYTYAPYHAVDVYVRGALAESFALATLPFVWYFLYKLINKNDVKSFSGLSFSLFVLFSTHNISMLMYAPFTLLWALFWILYLKNYSSIKYLSLSGIVGFGMASFFILPAIFEQNLIDLRYMTSVYYTYEAHFADLNQLFISRFWGDGGSVFGEGDGMSFSVGWPHWWNLFWIIPAGLLWIKRRKYQNNPLMLGLLVVFFFFTAFLTHQRSVFLWKLTDIAVFIQFPWRFLGLSMFFIALAGGAVGKHIFLVKYPLALAIIVLTFIFNISYFTPVHFSREVKDSEKLSGIAFELQQRGGNADYLPKDVKVVPEYPAPKEPKFVKGKGVIDSYQGQSNGFLINVDIEEDSEIVFPYIYFPRWKAEIDGVPTDVQTNGAHNVIKLSVPRGKHQVEAKFYNTPIRNIANTITTISFTVFIIFTFKKRHYV